MKEDEEEDEDADDDKDEKDDSPLTSKEPFRIINTLIIA